MDGLRNPVGDEPPEVYWKRRLVVVIGIVILGLVIWFVFSKVFGGSDEGATPGSSPEPTAGVTTSGAPADSDASGAQACGSDDLAVTTVANPAAVATESPVKFDVSVAYDGTSTCLLDTGAEGTELLITSGSDRIFSSADCPDDATIPSTQLLLEEGAKETLSVTWNGQRSLPECATVTAVPGAGTYNATLTLQGVTSEPAVFNLT